MTSLELNSYREWLMTRRLLASDAYCWTWIQTHVPDWFLQLTQPKRDGETFIDPVGPQPEQIRLLTYCALAAGFRGLAFWSDRFLADSHTGRDRLLAMARAQPGVDAPRTAHRPGCGTRVDRHVRSECQGGGLPWSRWDSGAADVDRQGSPVQCQGKQPFPSCGSRFLVSRSRRPRGKSHLAGCRLTPSCKTIQAPVLAGRFD